MFALAVGAAFGVAVYVSSQLRFEAYRVAIVWPAGGILLGALLVSRADRWPDIALATYLGLVAATVPRLGYTWTTAAIFQAAMLLQIGLPVLIARAATRSIPNIADPRVLLWLAAGLAVFAFPGGMVRNWLIRGLIDQPIAAVDIGRTLTFAMAVVVGTLNFAPFVASCLSSEWRARYWHRRVVFETAIVVGCVIAVSLLPPLYLPIVQSDWPITMTLPMVLFIWASLRVGLPGLSACITAYMLVASWRASTGVAPFDDHSAEENVVLLQLWVLALSVPTLAMAAVLDDHKRATRMLEESEARARELAGRLIAAQEQERSRIGRELHDNIGQLASSISIGLSRLRRRVPQESIDMADDATRLQERVVTLNEEIRRVSHELHSGVLQHAGLPEAMRALCEEVEALGYAVEFSAEVARPLPEAVRLCLYRVAQEALRNAVKHSRMSRLRVSLDVDDQEAILIVSDDGLGFGQTLTGAGVGEGIGIASMRERLRLFGGRLSVFPAVPSGTEVRATIPLAP